MTHKTTITDNYILITSDEEIKEGDYTYHHIKGIYTAVVDGGYTNQKKIIAHLPLNDSLILEGVPLLPSLPNGEDDVEEKKKEYLQKVKEEIKDKNQDIRIGILGGSDFGFVEGYNKAKEKYRFTEEDIWKAFDMGKANKLALELNEEIILPLSQPKMPIGFNVEKDISDWVWKPKIINGVMQGEWIFEYQLKSKQ